LTKRGNMFGWSLPPGCGKLPGEESELPNHIICPNCQSHLDFSTMETYRHEPVPERIPFNPEFHNPHAAVLNPQTNELEIIEVWGDTAITVVCRQCGTESTGEAVYADEIVSLSALHIPEIMAEYSTYESWEVAAVGEPFYSIPYQVLNLLKWNQPLYNALDRVWYFFKKCYQPRQCIWVNGLGDRLCCSKDLHHEVWYLNDVEILRRVYGKPKG